MSGVRPGGDPGLPVSFHVQRVIRVESSELWERILAMQLRGTHKLLPG